MPSSTSSVNRTTKDCRLNTAVQLLFCKVYSLYFIGVNKLQLLIWLGKLLWYMYIFCTKHFRYTSISFAGLPWLLNNAANLINYFFYIKTLCPYLMYTVYKVLQITLPCCTMRKGWHTVGSVRGIRWQFIYDGCPVGKSILGSQLRQLHRTISNN